MSKSLKYKATIGAALVAATLRAGTAFAGFPIAPSGGTTGAAGTGGTGGVGGTGGTTGGGGGGEGNNGSPQGEVAAVFECSKDSGDIYCVKGCKTGVTVALIYNSPTVPQCISFECPPIGTELKVGAAGEVTYKQFAGVTGYLTGPALAAAEGKATA